MCSVIGEDLNDALPASCGVGVASRVDHTPSPQEATCILCQEETKDISVSDKLLVQAVYVQRSAVLRRGEPLDTPSGNYPIAGNFRGSKYSWFSNI